MKKALLAVLIGSALGLLARSALANPEPSSASGSGVTCGTQTCSSKQECCVSPGPRTYTCVPKNTCRWN